MSSYINKNMNLAYQVIYTWIVIILLLSGLLGNSFWFAVLMRLIQYDQQTLNYASKLFLSSMTGGNLCLVSIVGIPMLGAVVDNGWPYGQTMCSFVSTMTELLFTSISLSLFAVNLDRYLAVMKPFHHHKIITKSRANIGVVLIWIVALTFGIVLNLIPGRISKFVPRYFICFSSPATGTENLVNRTTRGLAESPDILRSVWALTVCYLSILVSIILFLRMFVVGRQHNRKITGKNQNQALNSARNKKAYTSCFLMTVGLLLCTVPVTIDTNYEHFLLVPLPSVFGNIANLLILAYGTLNFCIYYIRNDDFRAEAVKLIRLIKDHYRRK